MRLIVALFVCSFLAACSNDSDGPTSVDAFSGELPLQAGWLAARQPDNALAYLRIPYLLGLTSAPKDNALGPMMSSEAHVAQIQAILEGLDKNVAAKPGLENPAVQWLFRHQRSPLEMSIGPVPGSKVKTPTMIVSIGTAIDTAEAATEAFGALITESVPGGAIEGDFSAGSVKILGTPMPGFANFDADSGRFVILVGPGVNEDRLSDTLSALADVNPNAPMKALESRIDESRQGYFAWTSVKEAFALSQMFIPTNVFDTIDGMGLAAADAIALGYGVSRGKTRFTVLADIPNTGGYRALVPVPTNALELKTTAAPNFAVVASLPSREELEAILAEVASDPQERAEFEESIDKLSELLGADVRDVYELISGEIIYVNEAVGGYGAYRLDDPSKLDSVLQTIATKLDSPITSERLAGIDISYWKLPSAVSMFPEVLEQSEAAGAAGTGLEIYSRLGTHMFWTIEGDYAIFASTPQVLKDRKRRGTPVQLGDWLDNTQQQDLRHAMLGFSISADGLPRFAHQTYISSLVVMTDIADVEFSPWDIPSADDLNLPEAGAIGMSFVSEESIVGMEVTMEHSPLDLAMSGGGMTTIAALGIVAAVAIPAYQDYTIRAQVGQGLFSAEETKAAVAQFYIDNDRFPNADEAELYWREGVNDVVEAIEVEADIGRIIVYLDGSGPDSPLYDSSLWLTPYVDNNLNVVFNCHGEMDQKYLPSACRN